MLLLRDQLCSNVPTNIFLENYQDFKRYKIGIPKISSMKKNQPKLIYCSRPM